MNKKILSVNIDHIATIRNARNSSYPSLLRAMEMCKNAGAEILTIHLREDRRHIRDKDAEELCNFGNSLLPVNLEIAPTDEMIAKAILLKPKFVCFVPEKRNEITTEGGLDLNNLFSQLKMYVKKLQSVGIITSLFIEPKEELILKAKEIGTDKIELHTGKFADLFTQGDYIEEFTRIKKCAEMGVKLGLKVDAGHGLDFASAKEICKIDGIKILHIGHFLITESIFIGLENCIKTFLNNML